MPDATFSWDAMPGAVSYDYQVQDVTAGNVVFQQGNTLSTSVFVSGLLHNTMYMFWVRTKCSANNSNIVGLGKITSSTSARSFMVKIKSYIFYENPSQVNVAVNAVAGNGTETMQTEQEFEINNYETNALFIPEWRRGAGFISDFVTPDGAIKNSFIYFRLLGLGVIQNDYIVKIGLMINNVLVDTHTIYDYETDSLYELNLGTVFNFNLWSLNVDIQDEVELIIVSASESNISGDLTDYINTLIPDFNYPDSI